MVNPILVKLAVQFAANKIAKRMKKSATTAVAGGVAATGIATIIQPELIDAIPEKYRGYVILAVAIVVAISRVRKEIMEAVREAKNGG